MTCNLRHPIDLRHPVHYTGWRRSIGCLKLQVIFRKRATIYRALLRKTTYKDKASYGSSQPCIIKIWYANSQTHKLDTQICDMCVWVFSLCVCYQQWYKHKLDTQIYDDVCVYVLTLCVCYQQGHTHKPDSQMCDVSVCICLFCEYFISNDTQNRHADMWSVCV